MNINLQIERLILEGADLSPRQRRQLQAAVEAELSRLLTVNGIPKSLQAGGSIPMPNSLNVAHNANISQMGQQIAKSIYGEFSQ